MQRDSSGCGSSGSRRSSKIVPRLLEFQTKTALLDAKSSAKTGQDVKCFAASVRFTSEAKKLIAAEAKLEVRIAVAVWLFVAEYVSVFEHDSTIAGASRRAACI